MKKIILEGFLGEKYGREWNLVIKSYSDIVSGIDCNYPGFREDLINYYDAHGGISILAGSELLEDPTDLQYPVSADTIIITPIPEGSKSGGAKLLLGALLIASLFIPGSGALLLMGAQALGAGAGLASFAALSIMSIGVNLALTGLQQLMAPDPSVDTNDQDYLFAGPESTVVSGNPVPVLCGEGIIGGVIISTAIIPGLPTSSGHIGGYTPGENGFGGLPGGLSGGAGGNLGGDIGRDGGDFYDAYSGSGFEDTPSDMILFSENTYGKPWIAKAPNLGVSYISPVMPHEIPANLLDSHRSSVTKALYTRETLWDDIDDVVIGTLPFNAALYRTLDGVTLSAVIESSSFDVTATLAVTLDGVTLDSQADAAYVAMLGSTLDDVTLASVGSFTGLSEIAASLAATLDGVSLSSTATADFIATLTANLDGVSLSSTGLAEYLAASSITLDGVTLSSASTYADPTAAYMSITASVSPTADGDFDVYTFTSSGTFEVTELGSDGTYGDNVRALVVAGGGAGGQGGGGAGGFLTDPALTVTTTSYTVTVGAGGTKVLGERGGAGGNSVFSSLTAIGGGGGGGGNNGGGSTRTGGSGGSGGGGVAYYGGFAGGAGTSGQGNAGADGLDAFEPYRSGGGGGAGSAPTNQTGGAGSTSDITGSSVTYAGGGGGRVFSSGGATPGGSGGAGGGGTGATNSGTGTAGTANTGGGGGGGSTSDAADQADGGNGGSGIVIIRVKAR